MGGVVKCGVVVRESSIRLRFTFQGERQQPTLMLNDEPMKPTAPNVRYAHRLAAEVTEKIKHGTFSMVETFPAAGVGTSHTVEAQFKTWMGGHRMAKSTKLGYESSIRFWNSAPFDASGRPLGKLALRAVKTSHILYALNSKPDLSGKTINNRVSVLRESFELAVLDGLLPSNPVENIPSASWQRQPVDPFSLEEAEAIIADMYKHYPEQVGNYITTKFFAGLRPGESFGQRWSGVDFASDHMQVRETIVGGEEKATTKTSTTRLVLLNDRSRAALLAQKTHTFMAGKHVFHDPRDGKRWGGEPKFRWYWVPTLRRLGIRHRPPYNTRHTYATMMLMAGLKPAFCAGQMGHSVPIFYSTYSKWIPGAGDRAEMDKLDQFQRSGPGLVLTKG